MIVDKLIAIKFESPWNINKYNGSKDANKSLYLPSVKKCR